MTAIAPEAPEATLDGGSDDGDGLSHYYCCHKNVAVCGADVSGHQDDPDLCEGAATPDMCVVCELMTSCPLCGEGFGR